MHHICFTIKKTVIQSVLNHYPFCYKLTKNVIFEAILDFKIFTYAIDKLFGYENVIKNISNTLLCTLVKLICKIQDFNGGHFGLQFMALTGKI